MPDDAIERGLELLRGGRCKTVTEAARNADCARSTLQEHWLKEKRGEPVAAKTITVEGAVDPATSWTTEKLLKEHGFDPQEWVIVRSRVQRYGNPDEPMHQLRFDVVPKAALVALQPADPGAWTPPPKPRRRKATATKPEKVLVCADLHAPLHEQHLCDLLYRVIGEEKPDKVKVLGDVLDAEKLSRWPAREKARGTNSGIQEGHNFFRSGREAHPDAEWEAIPGNHDWRFNSYTMGLAPELGGICAAEDDVPALDLRRLLLLDELGVKWTQDPEGTWETTHIVLSPLLAATHQAGGGKSAAQSALASYDHSIMQGDTHRLQFVYKTKQEFNANHEPEISIRASIQVGCLCSREAAFYSKRPDYQPGFVVAHIWPDGKFHVEPWLYVRGELFGPGGRRYS